MTILIKLGGSLITDKQKARTFRPESVRGLAAQLSQFRAENEQQQIVIGHGSGSFGHFEAQKHMTAQGVETSQDRLGFAQVGAAAAELSLMVLQEFIAAGLPVMRFQPSSSIVAEGGLIASFDSRALMLALEKQLVPLVHGDIAVDREINGGIISTEALFAHLVEPLRVRRIILLGEVAGVLNHRRELVPLITPLTLEGMLPSLKGSDGVDVTGGMLQKVKTMTALARRHPALSVVIASGLQEDILIDLLEGRETVGTRICADKAVSSPESSH
ncbi:MAG: isopentenyl phosphate kinase [Chloroflexota bacterium]|nr:isopentenyl phosphate kinase [Chloroflexota bacterium]